MNPLRIRAKSYRSFPDLDLDLPQGCIAILGTNGAGKSSLVGAIDLAIFGPQSRSLADALSDQAPDDDLLLELEIEHAGTLYRIRRTYSPRGRGKTTLDFEKGWASSTENGHGLTASTAHAAGWEPLTRASAKETQELIEQTLCLSRETFRASAFLAQGDGAAFSEAQPRDRKRILAEVLGLDRYDTLLQRARTDKQSTERELQQLEGRAASTLATAAEAPALEKQLSTIENDVQSALMRVTQFERMRDDLATEYRIASEHAARRAAAEAELRAALSALVALEARIKLASEATQQMSVARDELASLTTQEQLDELVARETELQTLDHGYREALAQRSTEVAAAREATTRRDEILTRAATAKQQAGTRMQDAEHVLENVGHAKCDRCEQVLGHEAALAAAKSLRDEAAALSIEANDLDTQAAAVEIPIVPDEPEPPLVDGITVDRALALTRTSLLTVREHQAQRARLEERIRTCEQTLDSQPDNDTVAQARTAVSDRQAALGQIGEPPNLDAIKQRGAQIAAQLEAARRQLDERKSQLARVEERLSLARAAIEAAAEIEKLTGTLRADREVLVQLERAFSPNGIPALIVENSAIPYLETEATRILTALGTSYQLELRTQAALKSGDGLRDTLDVVVLGDHGERPYETFSGGERTRINLALRIALARLLAHRRGAESRLLAIDEPEFLDEQGTAALVEVLRDLEGDFDRLYLISHVPALRDAFDQVLTVTKDEAGSRIEQGYIEPVEALA